MLKAIHDLYARDETFIDYAAHDLDNGAVWFNDAEFARWHDLDGQKILSIFTTDTRNKPLTVRINGDDTPELLSRNSGVLYCRAQDIVGKWSAGAPLRLDGRLYTVAEARLIQDQVWRVVLEANDR